MIQMLTIPQQQFNWIIEVVSIREIFSFHVGSMWNTDSAPIPFQLEIYAELLFQILSLFISFPKFPSSYFICIMENIVAGEDHYPIKIHASTFVSCWMSSNLEALSLCFTCRGTKGSLWAAYHCFKGTVPISTECNKHGLRTCPMELSHVSCVTQIKAWFFGLPSTFVAGFYLVWQISSIWSWAVIQLIWSNRQAPTGHIHNPNQRHIQCCFDHQFFSVKSLFYELEKDVLVSI